MGFLVCFCRCITKELRPGALLIFLLCDRIPRWEATSGKTEFNLACTSRTRPIWGEESGQELNQGLEAEAMEKRCLLAPSEVRAYWPSSMAQDHLLREQGERSMRGAFYISGPPR